MKICSVAALCLLAAVVCAATEVQAEDSVSVQVTGKNVNLVKAVAGEEVAEADAICGGINVLRVKEALDGEGNPVEGMAGKLLHYLPIPAASTLVVGKDNVDKVVVVKGKLHCNLLVLEVVEFETQVAAQGDDAGDAGDDWDDWDELGVTTMSQQQVI